MMTDDPTKCYTKLYIFADGFHKITSIDNGGLKFDKDEMEFSHPFFQKDQPYLLENIKRKIANQKPSAEEKSSLKPETLSKVMSEVRTMRGRQETLDSRFSAMKQENEALWREIAVLRQKHLKQQQIVNKLIQFLVTIVQPTRGSGGINNMSGVKRRFQLMINNVPEEQNISKMRKMNNEDETGPVIHELTEDLFDDENYDVGMQNSPNVLSPELPLDHSDNLDDISSPVAFKIEKPDPHYDEMEQSHAIVADEEVDGNSVQFIINELEPDNDWVDPNLINSTNQTNNPTSSNNFVISSVQGNYPMDNGSKKSATGRTTRSTRTSSDSILNVNQNKKQTKRKDPALRLKLNDSKSAFAPSSSSSGKLVEKAGPSVAPFKGKNISQGKTMPKPQSNEYTNGDFITNEMPNELFNSPVSNWFFVVFLYGKIYNVFAFRMIQRQYYMA